AAHTAPGGTCTGSGGNTDASGQCTITFTSPSTGMVTGHAAATLTIAGAGVTVQTDGVAPSSGDAVKTFVDTTPPVITVPAQPVTKEATGAQAPVSYTVSVTDAVDPSPVLTCVPASGSTFPVGNTTVTCNAHDASGNNATQKTFTVRVTDTTPPAFANVPANITVPATSGAGAAVSYTPPTASDLVTGSRPVNCTPASGSTFPIGMTTVTCSASDGNGNTGQATFTVTGTNQPDTTPPVITVPAQPVTKEATGPQTPVSYTVKVIDDTDPAPVLSCSPASGSTFPVGDTTVTCNAHDASGNNATPKS